MRKKAITTAFLCLALAACGPTEGTADAGETGADAGNTQDSGTLTGPTVLSTSPLDGAAGIPLNVQVTVTFSEAMDPATLNHSTFTLTAGSVGTPLAGTVIYANSKAVFWPADRLLANGSYTARLTVGAKSAAGVALEQAQSWTFTAGDTVAPGLPVHLGSAGGFVILAKSGISTVPTSAVTGDVAVSPAAATYITGFSLTADSTNVFSSSPQITGKIYAADYASPTPSNLTTAVSDMELAFADAAGRAPDFLELGAGDIGGMTLAPGVYRWSSGLLLPVAVTLSGKATDVWIFQIAQDLTLSSATRVSLTGGALPKNVFWQVEGRVELGTPRTSRGWSSARRRSPC